MINKEIIKIIAVTLIIALASFYLYKKGYNKAQEEFKILKIEALEDQKKQIEENNREQLKLVKKQYEIDEKFKDKAKSLKDIAKDKAIFINKACLITEEEAKQLNEILK